MPLGLTTLPNAKILFKGHSVRLRDFYRGQRGVLFGGPQLPSMIVRNAADLDQLLDFHYAISKLRTFGIGPVVCLYPNDPYVLKAWATAHDIGENILIISDSNLRLSSMLGLVSSTTESAPWRLPRFAFLIDADGSIEWSGFGIEAYPRDLLMYLSSARFEHRDIERELSERYKRHMQDRSRFFNSDAHGRPPVRLIECPEIERPVTTRRQNSRDLTHTHPRRMRVDSGVFDDEAMPPTQDESSSSVADGANLIVSSCSGEDEPIPTDEEEEEDEDEETADDTGLVLNTAVFYKWRGLTLDASVRTDLLLTKNLKRIYLNEAESQSPRESGRMTPTSPRLIDDALSSSSIFSSTDRLLDLGPADSSSYLRVKYLKPSSHSKCIHEIAYTPKQLRVSIDLRSHSEGFGSIMYRGQVYTAFEFHVIGPSQHHLNSFEAFRRPVEIRILHTNHGAVNSDIQPKLLVLAVTFKAPCLTATERENVVAQNPFINSVLNIPTLRAGTFEVFQATPKALYNGGFDLQTLISSGEGYVAYNGVLSAMNEKVTWLVQVDPLPISRRQLAMLRPYLYHEFDILKRPEDAYSLAYVFRYMPKLASLKCQSSTVLVDYIIKKTRVLINLTRAVGQSAMRNMSLDDKQQLAMWLRALSQVLIEQDSEIEDLKKLISRALSVFNVDDEQMVKGLVQPDTTEPSSLYLWEFLPDEQARQLISQLESDPSGAGVTSSKISNNHKMFFTRSNTSNILDNYNARINADASSTDGGHSVCSRSCSCSSCSRSVSESSCSCSSREPSGSATSPPSKNVSVSQDAKKNVSTASTKTQDIKATKPIIKNQQVPSPDPSPAQLTTKKAKAIKQDVVVQALKVKESKSVVATKDTPSKKKAEKKRVEPVARKMIHERQSSSSCSCSSCSFSGSSSSCSCSSCSDCSSTFSSSTSGSCSCLECLSNRNTKGVKKPAAGKAALGIPKRVPKASKLERRPADVKLQCAAAAKTTPSRPKKAQVAATTPSSKSKNKRQQTAVDKGTPSTVYSVRSGASGKPQRGRENLARQKRQGSTSSCGSSCSCSDYTSSNCSCSQCSGRESTCLSCSSQDAIPKPSLAKKVKQRKLLFDVSVAKPKGSLKEKKTQQVSSTKPSRKIPVDTHEAPKTCNATSGGSTLTSGHSADRKTKKKGERTVKKRRSAPNTFSQPKPQMQLPTKETTFGSRDAPSSSLSSSRSKLMDPEEAENVKRPRCNTTLPPSEADKIELVDFMLHQLKRTEMDANKHDEETKGNTNQNTTKLSLDDIQKLYKSQLESVRHIRPRKNVGIKFAAKPCVFMSDAEEDDWNDRKSGRELRLRKRKPTAHPSMAKVTPMLGRDLCSSSSCSSSSSSSKSSASPSPEPSQPQPYGRQRGRIMSMKT